MPRAKTDLDEAMELLAGRRGKRRAKDEGCPHPGPRLYAWTARDDTSKGSRLARPGEVFCVACCECGAVLAGGAQLPSEEEEKPS